MRDDDAATDPESREQLTTDERAGRPPLGPPPRDPLAHYQLREPLGRGGMGEVVAAHDAVLGRDVAIKRMLHDQPAPHLVDRFLREARIQARLDHPAIPPVHELARDRTGRPYFVMKRLGGTLLSEVIAAITTGDEAMLARFPLQRRLRAFADVCLAIEFAHTRGVIHRDLKPANIMLGEFGETYVLDWGIAKVVGDSDPELADLGPAQTPEVTQAGAVVGTPAYMAPEQRRPGLEIDGRADVFALGCILFELLAGRWVMRGDAADRPRRPSQVLGLEIAPELDDACAAATAIDRDHRIASARELGERVQRYLDGDRDLAARRTLAAEQLAAARTSVTAGDEAAAMREAGRALALDPTLAPAAELVTRLMLEPPAVIPPALATELVTAETDSVKQHAHTAVYVYLAYLLFVPYFAMMGVKQPVYLAVMTGVLLALAAIGVFNARRGPSLVRRYLVVGGNAVLILLMARMLTPFTLAPGIAAVTAMVLIPSPMYQGRISIAIACAFCAALAIPFGLEILGVVSPTMSFGGDQIVLTSPALELPAIPSMLGVLLYAPGFVVVGTLLARYHARIHREANRKLHLQAWRLRQLVA